MNYRTSSKGFKDDKYDICEEKGQSGLSAFYRKKRGSFGGVMRLLEYRLDVEKNEKVPYISYLEYSLLFLQGSEARRALQSVWRKIDPYRSTKLSYNKRTMKCIHK